METLTLFINCFKNWHMKKFLLLFLAFSLSIPIVKSQSLELMNPDGSAIENDTVYISTTDVSSDIEVPVFVKNISDKSKDVFVKLYVKQIVTGSSAVYCWNNCFDIATNISTEYLTVTAGDTIKDFYSTLTPNDISGLTEIMYTFFVNKSSDDSVSVTIIYDILTTGVNNLSMVKESISAYPNPVQKTLNFEYNMGDIQKADISVYDIVGKRLKTTEIYNTGNRTEIDFSGFKTGIYIWTFEVDGVPIKTEKVIKR